MDAERDEDSEDDNFEVALDVESILEDELDSEDGHPDTTSITELQKALNFIQAFKEGSLDNGDLDDESLRRLRDPPAQPPAISNPVMRFSLDHFCRSHNCYLLSLKYKISMYLFYSNDSGSGRSIVDQCT
jgi:hypothetical protein